MEIFLPPLSFNKKRFSSTAVRLSILPGYINAFKYFGNMKRKGHVLRVLCLSLEFFLFVDRNLKFWWSKNRTLGV